MTDPYCRLRVPVYRKTLEAVFFLSFIALYYYVLMARDPLRISPVEILLYIWIFAFAYDQIGGLSDTGIMFYQKNFWSLWNLGIIGTGFTFLIARKFTRHNPDLPGGLHLLGCLGYSCPLKPRCGVVVFIVMPKSVALLDMNPIDQKQPGPLC